MTAPGFLSGTGGRTVERFDMSSKDAPFDREAQARKASAKSTCSFCDSTSARKSAEQSTIAETGVWFPATVRCIHRPR